MNSSTRTTRAPQDVTDRLDYEKDGWKIHLETSNALISSALISTSQVGSDPSFVSELNSCLVGMTLRQARDHGVQQACLKHALARKSLPVQGIVMPANYSPTSKSAAKALRAAIDSVLATDPTAWNFDDNGISEMWRKRPLDERRRSLDGLVSDFLTNRGQAGAVTIVEIDVHDRVFLEFGPDYPINDKPLILMQLERFIRDATRERIELFVSEMKDNNRIRRL
jgi:hypothetical protein